MKLLKKPGFSLVEIAIVLAIVALLAAGSQRLLSSQLDRYKIEATKNKLRTIEEAILLYKEMNGVLPCPAYTGTIFGDPDRYGHAVTHCDTRTDPPASSYSCIHGELGCSGHVIIGALPFKALNISKESTIDAWGNQIAYAVDKRLTKDFAIKTVDITIVNIADNVVADANTMGGVVFVLFSHGRNGVGAYKPEGGRSPTCTSSMKDYENCNDDTTFRVATDNKYSKDFDDIVIWRTKNSLLVE
jgi:prepilin-type N-terminal cleavage/methylation domain-containing protein